MLRTPAVAVAAIVGGTVVGLGMLAVIGVLLYAGKDTTALLTLVNLVLTGGSMAKIYSVAAKAERIESNTNGTTTRLMDHALGPQPSADQ